MTVLTYVMGQLNLQFQRDELQPIVNHYTQQQALMAQLQLWMPPPQLTLNLRELDQPTVISQSQINQIKKSGNNLTLFIHGYNVSLGSYGAVLWTNSKTAATSQQIYYREQNILQQFDAKHDDLYLSEQQATILRDVQHIEQQFGAAAIKLQLDDDQLNGEGAHNWWLHMEHNLNMAAGFNGFDYHYQAANPAYTRILNIAWAGDPASPLDYIAVEPIAAKTAYALLPSIQRLFDAGIALNVIAHSAGNIVLIKLMALLGQLPRYHNCFAHVFMWEAAMPNNVLSPNADQSDNSLTGFWQTSKAYLSAQKIHILYSHHDNILGPIPFKNDHTKDLRLVDKWYTPGDGPAMATTALSLDILDQELGVPNALQSCYHVAHLFQIPLTMMLFDTQARQDLYQHWREHYCYNRVCKRSLKDQVMVIQYRYPQAFNDLALFISLYAAILHDGILAFFANSKNDKRLINFLRQLSPLTAARLLQHTTHAMTATIDYRDRHKIYMKLSHYAKQYLRFSYLKSLWCTWIHQEQYYITREISTVRDFLLAKSHEHILENALFYMQHHTELDMELWQYLFAKFKQPNATPVPLFKRGAIVAERGAEVAALLITILNMPGLIPRPALGYSGVDKNDIALKSLLKSGRIKQYDQSNFLLHHSAMKVVTNDDAVFKKVYQDIIMGSGMRFGTYQ